MKCIQEPINAKGNLCAAMLEPLIKVSKMQINAKLNKVLIGGASAEEEYRKLFHMQKALKRE